MFDNFVGFKTKKIILSFIVQRYINKTKKPIILFDFFVSFF